MLELRPLQASLNGGGLTGGDLVLAEDLEEAEVAEFAAVDPGQEGVETVAGL
ncbi:hypothetical protein [Streptomyces brasiliensis]|uniref:Uncharacterized protein n=1 Tax=Streptomyces brasiliensis TaxID=1954 RepID=A0A917P5U6_9ACTN|nr:hypothetical protein [Streptomyces brasiliensis]GGJ63014.1 hypothetical protein GCM10010121_087120 [Streptomyces brasiliensis]